MTLPGADTMKAGIMGDDCFRFRSSGSNCSGIVSIGESSGVWVPCDEVPGDKLAGERDEGERGFREPFEVVSPPSVSYWRLRRGPFAAMLNEGVRGRADCCFQGLEAVRAYVRSSAGAAPL